MSNYIKWVDRVNLPKEEGFYWARTSRCQWWNLMVHVVGDSPFFKVNVYDLKDRKFHFDYSIYDVEEFGPRIEDAPKITEKRQDWSK